MATQEQIANFISNASGSAQRAYLKLGKVLPSIAIGMACVESAYGTAGSCKRNSFLGQKVGSGKTATTYWPGKFFTSRTQEEYTVGNHTVINAAFRSYESMDQCFLNYYELLNTKLYSRVECTSDYEKQMSEIKACGYMTSSTEVNSVISIIKKYNLTQYDTVKESTSSPVNNSPIVNKIDGTDYLQVADLILDGQFGNGDERKKNVENLGLDYNREQSIVNYLILNRKYVIDAAIKCIKGELGNGSERQNNISKLGLDPATVQKLVNQTTQED